MNNFSATLDNYITTENRESAGKEQSTARKRRKNLLDGECLANNQDDLGNVITKWDHIHIIHLSKYCGKPEYIHVVEEGLSDALDEYERDNLIDIQYYGRGEKFIREMEGLFGADE